MNLYAQLPSREMRRRVCNLRSGGFSRPLPGATATQLASPREGGAEAQAPKPAGRLQVAWLQYRPLVGPRAKCSSPRRGLARA